VRHGIRTRVWRELPFSARRAILGTLRTVDRIEEWLDETWRTLHRSPAWIFVAVVGSVGIGLTVLLFLTLSQELMAAGSQGHRVRRPIIEPAAAVTSPLDTLDSRLCLDDVPKPAPHYAADFAFADDATWAQVAPRTTPDKVRDVPPQFESRDVSPRPPERRVPMLDDIDLFAHLEPRAPMGTPDLQPNVQFLRQRVPGTPPGARVRTLGRSAALATEIVEVDLAPREPDGWSPFEERGMAVSITPQRYAGAADDWSGQVVGARATDDDAFADAGAWGPRAEIGFRVELHAPNHAAPSAPGRSALVIRNVGAETIRRLEVTEFMPSLDVVTDALPGGQVQDDLLWREIQRLRAGRERTLSLDWFPVSMNGRRHEARVMAEAFVGATVDITAANSEEQEAAPPVQTEPELPPSPIEPRQPRPRTLLEEEPTTEPPPSRTPEPTPELPAPSNEPPRRTRRQPAVECTVRGGDTVRTGEVAEITVEVRNTGGTILHNVRIWADLPPALQHRYGPQLERRVERLSPGTSHVAVLRVLGTQPGNTEARIRVLADEPVNASAAGRVAVVQGAGAPARLRAALAPRVDPCCGCECGPRVLWIGSAF